MAEVGSWAIGFLALIVGQVEILHPVFLIQPGMLLGAPPNGRSSLLGDWLSGIECWPG